MTTPFVGEIRLIPYNFAPVDWALCNGTLLNTKEYAALYSLIGTTYGGNGTTTFALPDLRSRIPVHVGTGHGASYAQGEAGGAESVKLTFQQMPVHVHAVNATGSGQTPGPSKLAFPAVATPAGANIYGPPGTRPTTLWAGTIGLNPGGQAHPNVQPYLGINFVISLFGILPTPT
jgi:microcystin-dependent protein